MGRRWDLMGLDDTRPDGMDGTGCGPIGHIRLICPPDSSHPSHLSASRLIPSHGALHYPSHPRPIKSHPSTTSPIATQRNCVAARLGTPSAATPVPAHLGARRPRARVPATSPPAEPRTRRTARTDADRRFRSACGAAPLPMPARSASPPHASCLRVLFVPSCRAAGPRPPCAWGRAGPRCADVKPRGRGWTAFRSSIL